MKSVYLIPGFMASDLFDLSSLDVVWWDTTWALLHGLQGFSLSPDGVTPLPPNGLRLGAVSVGQNPWPNMLSLLQQQLDPAEWQIAVGPYDWRLFLGVAADQLATNIISHSTPAEPATIVGHSAGGLVACLAWQRLVIAGKQNLCRRIISICSPFQGSYAPQQFAFGQSASVQQLLALASVPATQFSAPLGSWALAFLNAVALTWPCFYELMPSLLGAEAATDPNRALLYDAGNYDVGAAVSQNWLNHATGVFQPAMQAPDTFPPDYVMTCVVASGLNTSRALSSTTLPIALSSLSANNDGDATVTAGSQLRTPSLKVSVVGSHQSVPLAITTSGLLAQLITDPRGPLTPPPPAIVVANPLPFNTTDPPEAEPYNPVACIGGG